MVRIPAEDPPSFYRRQPASLIDQRWKKQDPATWPSPPNKKVAQLWRGSKRDKYLAHYTQQALTAFSFGASELSWCRVSSISRGCHQESAALYPVSLVVSRSMQMCQFLYLTSAGKFKLALVAGVEQWFCLGNCI